MNHDEQADQEVTSNPLNVIAAILLLIQLLIFFLYYNFTADIYVLGIGWLFLIPGFILVILSEKEDSKVEEKLERFTIFSKHFGWSIISLSLSWITQEWFAIFIAMGFVIVMILDILRINASK